MISKILEFIKSKQSEMVLALAVVLIAIISFQSGKISALHHFNQPLEIRGSGADISLPIGNIKPKGTLPKAESSTHKSISGLGRVVASKNSKSYHFLWCSGAKRIKEENKITFASEQEAQSQGYTLASNCQR